VQRDAVGTGFLGDQRGTYRIRINGATRLPKRRNVVYVDTQM
jgi:hypothetical protein